MIIRGKRPSFMLDESVKPRWVEKCALVFRKVEACLDLLKSLNIEPSSEILEQISLSTLEKSICLLEEFTFLQFSTKFSIRDLIQYVQSAALLFDGLRKEPHCIRIIRKTSSTSLQQKMSLLFSHENVIQNDPQNIFEHCNYSEIDICCEDTLKYIFSESILDKYTLLYRFVSKCEYTVESVNNRRCQFKNRKICAVLHRSSSLLTSFMFYLKNICLCRDFASFQNIADNV